MLFRSQSCPTLCDPIDSSPLGSSAMGFSRQEHWSGLPLLSPGGLPEPEIESRSPALQAYSLLSEPPGKAKHIVHVYKYITYWCYWKLGEARDASKHIKYTSPQIIEMNSG